MALRSLKTSEHDEQVAVVRWFNLVYRNHPAAGRLFAVPNGGHRHAAVAGKLKAEGVRKGIPDLQLPYRAHGFVGLVIEMKAVGGAMTAEQADWLDWYTSQGWMAVCCKGSQAAIDTIKTYLGAQ